ncbi:hypothetical protein Trydic_g12810 [Trypoxylus dichotomus]
MRRSASQLVLIHLHTKVRISHLRFTEITPTSNLPHPISIHNTKVSISIKGTRTQGRGRALPVHTPATSAFTNSPHVDNSILRRARRSVVMGGSYAYKLSKKGSCYQRTVELPSPLVRVSPEEMSRHQRRNGKAEWEWKFRGTFAVSMGSYEREKNAVYDR